jgi:thioesterase domain-containing protein/acyl carrier protein
MITPESKNLEYSVRTVDTCPPDTMESLPSTAREEAVKIVLLAWWRELLDLQELHPDDDFFDLGGHSLTGVQLFSRIKSKYGIDLGLSTLFEARTVRELAKHICELSQNASGDPPTWSSLVAVQPKGSKPPVFWLPGAFGTSMLAFREISLLLGPEQPAYGFEAKMPEENEELETVQQRASRFVSEMRSLQPQGPYSLIGFCGGGFIAYEMAQQLAAVGEKVRMLAMVECYVDDYPYTRLGRLRYHIERTTWRTQNVLRRGPKGVAQWIAGRSKSLFEGLLMRARWLGARLVNKPLPKWPSEPVDEYAKVRRCLNQYSLASYPGKSVVIIGRDSYNFRGLSRAVDPRLVWCKLSKGGSEVRVTPGDHTDLLEAPMMQGFAEQLRSCLEHSLSSSAQ